MKGKNTIQTNIVLFIWKSHETKAKWKQSIIEHAIDLTVDFNRRNLNWKMEINNTASQCLLDNDAYYTMIRESPKSRCDVFNTYKLPLTMSTVTIYEILLSVKYNQCYQMGPKILIMIWNEGENSLFLNPWKYCLTFKLFNPFSLCKGVYNQPLFRLESHVHLLPELREWQIQNTHKIISQPFGICLKCKSLSWNTVREAFKWITNKQREKWWMWKLVSRFSHIFFFFHFHVL